MIKQMCLLNEKTSLRTMIMNHDCHVGKESGCTCGEWMNRIREINQSLKEERKQYEHTK